MNHQLTFISKSGHLEERIGRETILFDPATKEIHCLDAESSTIFDLCTAGCQLEHLVKKMGIQRDEIHTRLAALCSVGLMEESGGRSGLSSRREFIQNVAKGAAAVGITSLAAPAPAAAASCLPAIGTGGCSSLVSSASAECLDCCEGTVCMSTFQTTGSSCANDTPVLNRTCRTPGSLTSSTQLDCSQARANNNGGFYDCCIC